MAKDVAGYSSAQVALHWIVVALVAFQFVAHEGIEDAWRAYLRADPAPEGSAALAAMHVAVGTLVLLAALARIYLRVSRGAPPPPAGEPRLLQLLAEAVHRLIYVLLIALPLSGAAAWFFGVRPAGTLHSLLTNVLLAAIVLHIAGALFQHFVRRSDVLMRMLRPERSPVAGPGPATRQRNGPEGEGGMPPS